MWSCPKCAEEVDEDFDVCWQCGTDRAGLEDASFVSADDSEAIYDPAEDGEDKTLDALSEEFGEEFPVLVNCYMADSITEARFVADRLREISIPATSDKQDLNVSVLGGFMPTAWGAGPCVRVRPQDVIRAQTWVEDYLQKRRDRRDRLESE